MILKLCQWKIGHVTRDCTLTSTLNFIERCELYYYEFFVRNSRQTTSLRTFSEHDRANLPKLRNVTGRVKPRG